MNWIKELKVGDGFYHEDKSYYAIITEMDSDQVRWIWYRRDGGRHSSPYLYLKEFYDLDFIIPMTDLDRALL